MSKDFCWQACMAGKFRSSVGPFVPMWRVRFRSILWPRKNSIDVSRGIAQRLTAISRMLRSNVRTSVYAQSTLALRRSTVFDRQADRREFAPGFRGHVCNCFGTGFFSPQSFEKRVRTGHACAKIYRDLRSETVRGGPRFVIFFDSSAPALPSPSSCARSLTSEVSLSNRARGRTTGESRSCSAAPRRGAAIGALSRQVRVQRQKAGA